jgi:hypothetical protein
MLGMLAGCAEPIILPVGAPLLAIPAHSAGEPLLLTSAAPA